MYFTNGQYESSSKTIRNLAIELDYAYRRRINEGQEKFREECKKVMRQLELSYQTKKPGNNS
jgi:hypothetical protein